MPIVIYQDIGISMYLCFCVKESESEVAQLCLTLCDPVDYSLPGFSVHGVFQARVLEWVAIAFSKYIDYLEYIDYECDSPVFSFVGVY